MKYIHAKKKEQLTTASDKGAVKEEKIYSKEELDEMEKYCRSSYQAGKLYIRQQWSLFGIRMDYMPVMFVRPGTKIGDSIPTMAVDAYGNLYINVRFGAKDLSADEFIGVLMHEIMHVMTMTMARLRGRRIKTWNVATDYIMNRDLQRCSVPLPKLGLVPVVRGDKDFAVIEDPHINKYISAYSEVNVAKGKVEIDLTSISAEKLYDIIREISSNADESDEGDEGEGDDQSGCRGEGEGTDGDQRKMDNGGDSNSDGPVVRKLQEQHLKNDQHLYGDLTPEQQKEAENEGTKLRDRAVNEQKKRGVEKGSLIDHLFDKITKSVVNWKSIIRTLMNKSTSHYDERLYNKRALPNKIWLPRLVQEESPSSVIFAIDTSGSIGQRELNLVASEVLGAVHSFPNISIRFILWHTSVYADAIYNGSGSRFTKTVHKGTEGVSKLTMIGKGKQKLLEQFKKLPFQSGGTTITSVRDYMEDCDVKPTRKDTLVFFTDGFVEGNPQFSKTPKKVFLIMTDSHSGGQIHTPITLKDGAIYEIRLDN